MAKKTLNEVNTANNEVKKTPIQKNDKLYNKPIHPVPKPKEKIGIDTDQEFYDTLIAAAQNNALDIGKLESFTQISQNRDQLYNLIDTMAEDSTVAAILETYAEDSTETNMEGRIIWATSDDDNIAKYITYLMDTMNIDKNAYNWMYSLIKYGDLYLRLYRESEFNDKLFDDKTEADEKDGNSIKVLTEDVAKILDSSIKDKIFDNTNITKEEAAKLDDLNEELTPSNETNILNEDVTLRLFSVNDRYVHYVEAIPNPAEIYELTRFGKSYAYIQAPTNVKNTKQNDVLQYNNKFTYSFKKRDVKLYEATEFVHAALIDNSSRTPEEVNIYLTDSDFDSKSDPLTYKVRRGQSILYNSYKIWREMMLLEYALLLNRVTKSSIVRIIGVEVGDMPKEQIGPHLMGIKSLMEQKSSIDVGNGMSEYTNPGPVENNIYVPTHNNVGTISTQQIGGDVNVTGLDDLDYFNNKFFGSLRVPKQYFSQTDDATGFNGGTSLSIISSRYAKTVKRIQNTFIQAITDAINLMLIDKGMTSYVNKFVLHMVHPTTQEEVDRQDSTTSKVQLTSDIMQLIGSDIKDIKSRLTIMRALLDDAISDPTVAKVLQDEIHKYEQYEEEGVVVDENGDIVEDEDTTGLTGDVGGGGGGFDLGGDDFGGDGIDLGGDLGGTDSGSTDTSGDLPTPADLGVDFTNSDI